MIGAVLPLYDVITFGFSFALIVYTLAALLLTLTTALIYDFGLCTPCSKKDNVQSHKQKNVGFLCMYVGCKNNAVPIRHPYETGSVFFSICEHHWPLFVELVGDLIMDDKL